MTCSSSDPFDLPGRDEWDWKIEKLELPELRTFCFHEYVRETEFLLDQVEKIDVSMAEVGWTPNDCRSVLSGRAEELASPNHSNFPRQMDLVIKLQRLAAFIFPLPPHLLLGKQLRSTPWKCLPDWTDDDLLPKGIFDDLTFVKSKSFSLNLNGLRMATHLEKPWISTVEERIRGVLQTVQSENAALPCKSKAPDRLFEEWDGSRTTDTRVVAIVARQAVFQKFHPFAIARAARTNDVKLPSWLKGQLFRIEGDVAISSDEVIISKDVDGLSEQNRVEELIMLAARPKHQLADLIDAIKEVAGALPPQKTVSALAGTRRVHPNLSPREYFEAALAALSSHRMATTINTEEYRMIVADVLLDRKASGEEEHKRKKPELRIPHTNAGYLRESRLNCKKHAKEFFPQLNDKQRRLRSSAKDWTIKV